MPCPADRPTPAEPPDTAVLYDVGDVARLCHAGEMPDWIELDGRRYWRPPDAIKAVIRASTEQTDHRPAA